MRIHRRTMLRGAAGAAITLPFLEAMRPATAAAQTDPPKRFIVFFSSNGTLPNKWRPSSTGPGYALSPILSPLGALRDRTLVLSGVNSDTAKADPGGAHGKGIVNMLTCARMVPEERFRVPSGPLGYAGGISLDQELAKHIGQETKIASLELGVLSDPSNTGSPKARMVFLGKQQPVAPENDPVRVFNRLFSDLDADPVELQRLRDDRRSVLDFVADDLARLQPKVSTVDRQRLDQHLTYLRDIEQRLDLGGGIGANCAVPTQPPARNFKKIDNYPAVGQSHMDLMAMALACDLTRVATLQWNQATSYITFPWLGITDNHHQLSHEGNSNAQAQTDLETINTWYCEQLAYLANALDQFPEGNGTVLDNTVIMWCSEIGVGNNHTPRNIPYVLVGGLGGTLATGQHLDLGGVPHGNLYVSLLNAMGVQTNTFGLPEFCTGPVPEVLA